MKIAAENTSYLFRMPTAMKAWLAYQAEINNRSMNAELIDRLTSAMADDPLRIVVRLCTFAGSDPYYCVSEGDSRLEDFWEGTDKQEAIAAAHKRIKELGLPRSALQFRVDGDELGFGTIVNTLPDIMKGAA